MMKRQNIVQNFTLTSSAQLSSPFSAQTRSVMITSNSTGIGLGGAFLLFGDSTGITASSSASTLFPAPWLDFFDVSAGQRVSVIEATTAHGTLSVTELS